MDGEFIKFNGNDGFVSELHPCLEAQAFLHFTYEASGGAVMVTDIQGVMEPSPDGPRLILSDPQAPMPLARGTGGGRVIALLRHSSGSSRNACARAGYVWHRFVFCQAMAPHRSLLGVPGGRLTRVPGDCRRRPAHRPVLENDAHRDSGRHFGWTTELCMYACMSVVGQFGSSKHGAAFPLPFALLRAARRGAGDRQASLRECLWAGAAPRNAEAKAPSENRQYRSRGLRSRRRLGTRWCRW